MSSVAGKLATRPVHHWPLVVGIALLLAIEALLPILGWLFPVEPLLRGWLVAFAIFSCVPIGSMTWLMIHRLTGGEWGRATAPVLRPVAAMCPLLIFSFVPVLAGIRHIYPWASDPAAIPADVAHWYLNGLSFLVRTAIALLGWSLLALCFGAGLGSGLLAGLGLTFFGLSISLVAVDWYLSLEPHYIATAFAAMIAIQQMLAALAVAALISPPAVDEKTAGDIGGLLIATLLGVVYLEFMTFVVAWYGDLPDKAEWFLKRAGTGWLGILVAALTVGALLPFAMLMIRTVRCSRLGLRVASALILFGTTLHFAWLLVPAFDDQAAVVAAACGGAAVLLFVSLLTGPALARLLEARHAE
jgi:hypothetical protein